MTPAVRYAGFWRRLAAAIVDSMVLMAVVTPLMLLFYGPVALQRSHGYLGLFDLFLNQVLPIVATVYFWTRFGATPGKRLLECEVADATRFDRIGVKQALLRYFGYLASLLPLGLGFLWIGWDPRKQGFHDKIAHTVVLYRPEDESTKSLQQLMEEAR